MSTEVTYNGIQLSYVKTEGRESYPVYDESDTDLRQTRYTYSCTGVYVAPSPTATNPAEEPADIATRVNHMLLQPRKQLLVTVNGRPFLQADAKTDANNGPKPRECTVTKVTDESFLVRWSVEVQLRDCPEGSKGRKYTSNRWSVDHAIDAANMSTITTHGRLTTTTDLLKGGTIDDLRGLCTPAKLPNFVRESMYQIQADGLAIAYTFVDKENYIQPPPDAVKMSGTYTRSTNNFGAMYWAEVRLRLEGRREVPKRRLMATCIATAVDKLFGAKADPRGRGLIKDGSFVEHLEANIVEVSLRGMCLPDENKSAGQKKPDQPTSPGVVSAGAAGGATGGLVIGADIGKILAEPAHDPRQIQVTLSGVAHPLLGCSLPTEEGAGIAPDIRGNLDTIRVWAAAFNDPCLDAAVKSSAPEPVKPVKSLESQSPRPTPGQPASSLGAAQPSQVSTPASITLVSVLPPWVERQNLIYLDQLPGVYEEYEVNLVYKRHNNLDVLDSTIAFTGSPTQTSHLAKKVQWANPRIELRADWTARKMGSPPTVPDWKEPKDGNAILKSESVEPCMVEWAPDGTNKTYTITGSFLYVFLDYKKVSTNSPIPPWMNEDSRRMATIPADKLVIFGDTGSFSPALIPPGS